MEKPSPHIHILHRCGIRRLPREGEVFHFAEDATGWPDLSECEGWVLAEAAKTVLDNFGSSTIDLKRILSKHTGKILYENNLVDAGCRVTKKFERLLIPTGKWTRCAVIIPRRIGLFCINEPDEFMVYDGYNLPKTGGPHNQVYHIPSSSNTSRQYFSNQHIVEPEPLRYFNDWNLRELFFAPPSAEEIIPLISLGPSVTGISGHRLQVGPNVLFLTRQIDNNGKLKLDYIPRPQTLLLFEDRRWMVVDTVYLEYFFSKHSSQRIRLYTESERSPVYLISSNKLVGIILPEFSEGVHEGLKIPELIRKNYPESKF